MDSKDHYGYFHIYNRGADKRDIFMDHYDRIKMLEDIRCFRCDDYQQYVDILGYCLMDNHFHLLVEQRSEYGLPKFMQKLGIGYTIYFNNRYRRTGVLFESGYKSKEIKTDSYLFHLYRYIHLNPLKLINKNWKKGFVDISSAMDFVYEYPWSSIRGLFSENNTMINNELVKLEFKSIEDFKDFLLDWVCFGVPRKFSFK
ncbi:transposase [Patescibacteria group bacterium]|nr:transposase [Patescibacteria group bacterium]MBU4452996.1 transposase [Patescibacteria group bacterium]MCG2687977.1 transposase [Candidatus Parcubacteria bacterium]